MSGRSLFREYAKFKGKQAKSFVRIEDGLYQNDILITLDNSGNSEETTINYKEMLHWVISKK